MNLPLSVYTSYWLFLCRTLTNMGTEEIYTQWVTRHWCPVSLELRCSLFPCFSACLPQAVCLSSVSPSGHHRPLSWAGSGHSVKSFTVLWVSSSCFVFFIACIWHNTYFTWFFLKNLVLTTEYKFNEGRIFYLVHCCTSSLETVLDA